MRIYPLLDPKPRKDLGRTLDKNLLVKDRFVKPMYEFAKSVTKTNSQIKEPKTYNKAMSNFIYGNRWHEAIDKEL